MDNNYHHAMLLLFLRFQSGEQLNREEGLALMQYLVHEGKVPNDQLFQEKVSALGL